MGLTVHKYAVKLFIEEYLWCNTAIWLSHSTRTPPHHMAEHHTAGSKIPQSHTAWSNGYGPELVSVEDVVGVRCYTILSCIPATTTNNTMSLLLLSLLLPLQLLVFVQPTYFSGNHSRWGRLGPLKFSQWRKSERFGFWGLMVWDFSQARRPSWHLTNSINALTGY